LRAIVVKAVVGGGRVSDGVAGLFGGRERTAVGEGDVVASAVGGGVVLVEVVDLVPLAFVAAVVVKKRHFSLSLGLGSCNWEMRSSEIDHDSASVVLLYATMVDLLNDIVPGTAPMIVSVLWTLHVSNEKTDPFCTQDLDLTKKNKRQKNMGI